MSVNIISILNWLSYSKYLHKITCLGEISSIVKMLIIHDTNMITFVKKKQQHLIKYVIKVTMLNETSMMISFVI